MKLGIGKSTVLDIEAARESAPVSNVRKLIRGAHTEPGVTPWLAALDENRTDGQPSDKVYALARAIAAVTVQPWRLSCRSEDWRKGADIVLLDPRARKVVRKEDLHQTDYYPVGRARGCRLAEHDDPARQSWSTTAFLASRSDGQFLPRKIPGDIRARRAL